MKKEISFEESMKRLDTIVNVLEKGDSSLEDSLKIFEEGLQLVASCDAQLKAFDSKLQEVLEKHSMED